MYVYIYNTRTFCFLMFYAVSKIKKEILLFLCCLTGHPVFVGMPIPEKSGEYQYLALACSILCDV